MSYLTTFVMPKVVPNRPPKEVNDQVDDLAAAILQRYNNIKKHSELKTALHWRVCKGEGNKVLFEIIAEQEKTFVHAKNRGKLINLQKSMKEPSAFPSHREYLQHLRDLSKGTCTTTGSKRLPDDQPERPSKIMKSDITPEASREFDQSESIELQKYSDEALIREVQRRMQTGDIQMRMISGSSFAKIQTRLANLDASAQAVDSRAGRDVIDLTRKSDEEELGGSIGCDSGLIPKSGKGKQ